MANALNNLSAVRNTLLSSMLPAELDGLRPRLTRVRLVHGQILHDFNERIEQVFFVEQGIISLVAEVDGNATGVEVGQYLAQSLGMAVVFMTANPRRIPNDFVGAIGVIAKPYTTHGLSSALRFLINAVHRPPPPMPGPASLQLAPAFKERWRDPA